MAATSCQHDSLLTFPFSLASPTSLFLVILHWRIISTPLLVFLFTFLFGFAHFSYSLYFLFCLCGSCQVKRFFISTALFLGLQCVFKFSERSSLRRNESFRWNLKQEKNKIAVLRFSNTHLLIHTQPYAHLNDKSNEHIKPLSYKTPAYIIHWHFLPCFSGGSVATCSFDTWQLPFLPSTCLLNLTGSLKASVSCVLIISTTFVKKNMHILKKNLGKSCIPYSRFSVEHVSCSCWGIRYSVSVIHSLSDILQLNMQRLQPCSLEFALPHL